MALYPAHPRRGPRAPRRSLHSAIFICFRACLFETLGLGLWGDARGSVGLRLLRKQKVHTHAKPKKKTRRGDRGVVCSWGSWDSVAGSITQREGKNNTLASSSYPPAPRPQKIYKSNRISVKHQRL